MKNLFGVKWYSLIDNSQETSKYLPFEDKDGTISLGNSAKRIPKKKKEKNRMTEWGGWSTGNCARNWNVIILTNVVCK